LEVGALRAPHGPVNKVIAAPQTGQRWADGWEDQPAMPDPSTAAAAGALPRALEDDDLMAQREVLCDECGSALEQLPEEGGGELQCAH